MPLTIHYISFFTPTPTHILLVIQETARQTNSSWEFALNNYHGKSEMFIVLWSLGCESYHGDIYIPLFSNRMLHYIEFGFGHLRIKPLVNTAAPKINLIVVTNQNRNGNPFKSEKS